MLANYVAVLNAVSKLEGEGKRATIYAIVKNTGLSRGKVERLAKDMRLYGALFEYDEMHRKNVMKKFYELSSMGEIWRVAMNSSVLF